MTHHTMTFDTLFYANQLKSVGVPEKQAEAQATLAKKQNDDILAIIDNSLATKHDIELVKRDIKELDLKIETVRVELKHDIKAMGNKTIIALAVILPTIISILEYLTKLRG